MKINKLVLIVLILLFGINCCSFASQTNSVLKRGIEKYKSKDYLGCLQDMALIINEDPTVAMAHYYSGMAFVKLNKKEEGIEAYTMVTKLNTNPHLTKLALNGIKILSDDKDNVVAPSKMDKKVDFLYNKNNFSTPKYMKMIKQIELDNYKNDFNDSVSDTENDNAEEKKLSQNTFEKKKLTDSESIPTDKEIADAVRTLAKVGFVQNWSNPYTGGLLGSNGSENVQLQILQQNGLNSGNMELSAMLPYLMTSQNSFSSNSQNINADFIRTMMMSNMMNNFNESFFDTEKKNIF